MRKKDGSIVYLMSAAIILIVGVFILMNVIIRRAAVVHNSVDNGLVAANLAAEIVDLDKFAEDRVIKIKDNEKSYEIFYNTLIKNLNLNNDEKIIGNKVNIDQFTIYNVEGKNVRIINIKPAYSEKLVIGGIHNVRTPSGAKIDSTSIYSRISYKVKGFFKYNTLINQATTDIKAKDIS